MTRDDEFTLDGYQREALRTDVLPRGDGTDDRFVLPLLGLAGEVGALATEWKKRRRDTTGYRAFTDELREELGDALWYMAVLANRAGLTLSEVAGFNLTKTREAYGLRDVLLPHELYDTDRPGEEQLPRQLAVVFDESPVDRGGHTVVAVTMRIANDPDTSVGDPIDDNSETDDDYRYHDVFHLAHMAVLGWSPVLRTILHPKRKRRGDARTDRIEDGGRAIAIEEGLTAAVFAEARRHTYFATADRVPHELVKTCARMTAHLEVATRSLADWDQAILTGYRVFNQLRRHRRGRVDADMVARTLQFTPIPA
ncbi:nucleoside triphosphate pyrophosphohydrolase family protein [Amycolatopsis sp., V23-08]|uniref:Nucleoside triphosphate pyrophosphohydrolase family protein n=1 Tax=Amycolatopsis heterodermiae TaxID=3110235 RepID=A0ABU5QXZ3_9PSEU|nr:nucleoside triphosphate pyrophosphohydrolase family protein [Amycolatopsis sp., V23-08]MEA5358294.1 nucleoside triphosphate pyrophosphohydrolase family protein [Amycolatopsis sp., V23-08]